MCGTRTKYIHEGLDLPTDLQVGAFGLTTHMWGLTHFPGGLAEDLRLALVSGPFRCR